VALLPPRPRRAESLISLAVILLLVLIGAGVFIKQFHYQPGRLGREGADLVRFDPGQSKPKGPAIIPALPAGFEELSEVETFDSENLYNKINGKAGIYLQSGFEKLTCQRFVSAADAEMWLEVFIYDMGSVRNAFAVYSVQRRQDAQPLTEPLMGYQAGGAVFLPAGRYYIEIIGSAETNQLSKAMLTIANGFMQKVGPDDNLIPELQLFPQANLIAQSYKLHLSNAFGFDGFTDTFSAGYRFGDATASAFISRRPDSEKARRLAGDYYKFLIENGATDKSAIATDVNGKAAEFYGVIEVVFTAGPFVAGVHGAENEASAKQLASQLYEKLSRAEAQ
jgi:hypothetical protein